MATCSGESARPARLETRPGLPCWAHPCSLCIKTAPGCAIAKIGIGHARQADSRHAVHPCRWPESQAALRCPGTKHRLFGRGEVWQKSAVELDMRRHQQRQISQQCCQPPSIIAGEILRSFRAIVLESVEHYSYALIARCPLRRSLVNMHQHAAPAPAALAMHTRFNPMLKPDFMQVIFCLFICWFATYIRS